MAEWHTPIRFLDDHRRDQLYPYAETFCVLREPTQHLASVAGYHLCGNQPVRRVRGTGIAVPSSRRRVDGVEVERAVKF